MFTGYWQSFNCDDRRGSIKLKFESLQPYVQLTHYTGAVIISEPVNMVYNDDTITIQSMPNSKSLFCCRLEKNRNIGKYTTIFPLDHGEITITEN